MAAITTPCRFFLALHSLASPTTESHLHRRPTNSLLCSDPFKPFFASKPNPTNTVALSRPNLYQAKTVAPKRSQKVLVISGLTNGNSKTDPESEPNDPNKEVIIDLKLPRRRLLVQFTCDLCGEITQRLVNPLAYERGLIYVQCAGCLQHHKLVDNLGLVVEYDLREEIDADIKEEEV